MISHLDRKLWRDLSRMKGQAFAVAMVMGCGLAMMIMARSLVFSLESTRREYYEANRFAEVFAMMKRAPNSLAARIKAIPGVGTVQPGIAVQVTIDLPELGPLAYSGQPGRGSRGRSLCQCQLAPARRLHRHAAARSPPDLPYRRH